MENTLIQSKQRLWVHALIFAAGIVGAIGFWFAEAAVHTYFFHDGPYLEMLKPHDINEVWMRTLISFLFIAIALLFNFLYYIIGLKRNLQILGDAFSAMRESLFIMSDGGMILKINAAFTKTTGYLSEEALGKKVGFMVSSEQEEKDFSNKLKKHLESEGSWEGEVWYIRKNGERYPVWLSLKEVLFHKKTRCFTGVFNDITLRKKADERIRQYALYDQLTGLINRRQLYSLLSEKIEKAKQHEHSFALAFFDIDGFKPINDEHGHAFGDEYLKRVAKLLLEHTRESDVVARIGGDEFIIILSELSGGDRAKNVMEQLLLILNETILTIGSVEIKSVKASIGIAVYPKDGDTVDVLLENSDKAMYHAKHHGKNQVVLYSKT